MEIKPIFLFNDPLNERKEISRICKDLQGCYIWVNRVNSKRYAGSSMNLPKRLSYYFQHETKKISYNSLIYNALNFHGLEKFSLIIIIMPGSNLKEVLNIEQFLLDHYNPEYNILKIAGSSKGLKLSPETIALMSERMKGKLHSIETKEKLSEAKSGKYNPMFGKTHSTETKLKMSLIKLGKSSKIVYLYEKNNLSIVFKDFSSRIEAVKYLECSRASLNRYLDKNKVYKDKWILSSTKL